MPFFFCKKYKDKINAYLLYVKRELNRFKLEYAFSKNDEIREMRKLSMLNCFISSTE